MPVFQYTARDARGQSLCGVSDAGTPEAVAAELRGRGLLVLRVEPAAADGPAAAVDLNPLAWLPPTRLDIEVGLQQLGAMLHSGLSLLSALRTVAEQARRRSAAALWREVAASIERGASVSGALSAHSRSFPDYVVQLVRVGESSGELDMMLTRAAEHLEQARNLRLTVVNALAYPVIVALLAVGVSSYMLLAVIPKIQRFLAAGGRALPPMTQALVDLSQGLRRWLPGLGLGLAAAAAALWVLRRWPPGRLALDAAWLRMPVVGHVLRLADTATFSRALGILLESGVALLDSLRTVEGLLRNRAMASRIAAARLAVTRGETMAHALAGRREFMPMLPRMIAVGEATGMLGQTLCDVARFHEAQLVTTIRRMSMLIEPVTILVVGGMVGFVYIAFFVAVFSLASGVR